jgi:inosose dehydratase
MQFTAQIGIWTDYEPVKREGVAEVIEKAGDAELDGIEIFSQHLAYYHNTPNELADILDAAGVTLSGVYFNVDHENADEYVNEADQLAETIAAVDGDFLVVGAGRDFDADVVRTTSDFKTMADMLNRIAERAANHTVKTVVHPHRGQLVETPADLESLLKAGLNREAIGLCPDAVHQAAVGADPYAIYEDHTDWVQYLHIGDTTEDGNGALMDEGILDQHRLHDPLFTAGYDGWVVIEGRTDNATTAEYIDHTRSYVQDELVGQAGE